jgi:hypothetical protein
MLLRHNFLKKKIMPSQREKIMALEGGHYGFNYGEEVSEPCSGCHNTKLFKIMPLHNSRKQKIMAS